MRLEEYRARSPTFARAADAAAALGKAVRDESRQWVTDEKGFGREEYTCWRVINLRRVNELALWEEKGGFDSEASMWGRLPCTINRYLPYMMEKYDIIPPWLAAPEVMLEIKGGSWPQNCVRYSDAAIGAFPRVDSGKREYASDVFVHQEDIPLAECWRRWKTPIEDIQRIYIGPEASSESREEAQRFAVRYGIRVEEGWPQPDSELEPRLAYLAAYLKARAKQCSPYTVDGMVDPYVAALGEEYDKYAHTRGWYPYGAKGASDAIETMLRRRMQDEYHYDGDRRNLYESCLRFEEVAEELIGAAVKQEIGG